MSADQTIVLNQTQIKQKIDRLAFQIHENHYTEKEIIMTGIADSGFRLAQLLNDRLQEISDIKVTLVPLFMNKKNPFEKEPTVDLTREEVENKVVILVDDVLNSGKTLIYGIKYFLKVPMKALRTVALIDRDHKRFPVKADYVGLLLSTTLLEHVRVELEDEMAVYLE
ncbi:MAG: phosphoribosyltransferase [Flavobacteriales bacterium]|nr:phosphoribosyltransferase [Flavobacteriales bacterium]